MPDQASTRYEENDFPGFKAKMEKLCPDCTVIYQNANGDVALQQQFNSVLAQGAKVIAYDRPIPDTPADYYICLTMKASVRPSRNRWWRI